MPEKKVKVLFVCLGNICRSPLAEGVFRQLVEEAGLADRFEIDSAGTSSYHIGDAPDARTMAVATARGVELTSRARQIESNDLQDFDYVLAMDRENLRNIQKLVRGETRSKVELLRAFDPEASAGRDVPDPYYGGQRGFEDVHDMVERSCLSLLQHIREAHSL